MNLVREQGPGSVTDEVLLETVTTIAEAEDCDPLELPPLYDAIGSEVFDRVFCESRPAETSFSYLDYQVTITGDDQVRVAEKQTTS